MALNLLRRPDVVSQVGTPLVPKRIISVPVRGAAVAPPAVGVRVGSFRLVIKKEHGREEPEACPAHLDAPELARLARALAYSFAALQRVSLEGLTEKDNFPALTSWIANNKTHWSLGRNLLVMARHYLMEKTNGFGAEAVAKCPGHGLPCLTFIDPPDALRNDPHPESASNEKCIRDAYAAAGWLTIIAKPIAPIKRTFSLPSPASKTPAPSTASGLVPRKPSLFLKRGKPDPEDE